MTLIAAGIYFLLRPELQNIIHLFNFSSLPLSPIEILVCSLIIFGVIIFLIGLFGYCGAKRESRTCLILVKIVVFLLLFILNIFSSAVYHFSNKCSSSWIRFINCHCIVSRSRTSSSQRTSSITNENIQLSLSKSVRTSSWLYSK